MTHLVAGLKIYNLLRNLALAFKMKNILYHKRWMISIIKNFESKIIVAKANDKSKRRGGNPATGEDVILRARRVLAFKCSGELGDKINDSEK